MPQDSAHTPDPGALARLVDEHEIRQVLHRYCRGIDRMDRALVAACYHPDATDEHGSFSGDADAFLEWCFRLLERYDRTQHFVTNVLVEPAGPHAARCESYGVAVHEKEGGPPEANLTTGFRFVDRFQKRDGAWRIASRVATTEWVRHTPDSQIFPVGEGLRRGRRDRSDPVYGE